VPAYFVPPRGLPLDGQWKKLIRVHCRYLLLRRRIPLRLFPRANDTEQRLVSIWSELLGREQIGVNDNFF